TGASEAFESTAVQTVNTRKNVPMNSAMYRRITMSPGAGAAGDSQARTNIVRALPPNSAELRRTGKKDGPLALIAGQPGSRLELGPPLVHPAKAGQQVGPHGR